jgi:hypothetical protein
MRNKEELLLYNIENRKKIINDNNNELLIKDFFLNDNLDDKNIYEFKNSHIQYNETDKFGILFSHKGGSTAIYSILEHNNLNYFKRDEFFNKEIKYHFNINKNRTENLDFKLDEFNKIVNGKSKKDLIIVTRNPIYKFLSGMYQDLSIEFLKSDLLYSFLKEKYKDENLPIHDSKDIDSLPERIIGEMAYLHVKNLFYKEENIRYGHSSLYNELFFNFLYVNKSINKSKIKIIDIDNPNYNLFEVFKKYYPEIEQSNRSKHFWTHRDKHRIILEGVSKHIKEDELHIKQFIRETVNQDYYYYKLLLQNYTEYEP